MLRQIEVAKKSALAALSGISLSLSFPNCNFWILAYAAFVPLFFAINGCGKKEAASLSYLCGLVFFGINIFWLRHVSILGYIILISSLSLFFGIFGLFLRYAVRDMRYAVFSIPAFWAALEYLRSNLFGGFGWSLLGYSQHLALPVIQISDITGAYGVSFLVMAANAAIYLSIRGGVKKNLWYGISKTEIPTTENRFKSYREAFFLSKILIMALTFSAVLAYGYFRLNEKDAPIKSLKISLIQGNIPQEMKWDEKKRDYILDRYIKLTLEAKKDQPELIIWPETALPGFLEEGRLFKKIEDTAKGANACLLIGAPSFDSIRGEIFNTAVLVSEEGGVLGRYDKLRLVPFGEYVPFEEHIGFLRHFIDKPIGNFARGRSYTVFEMKNGLRFGVLICFEDIFGGLVRRFVKEKTDFMVNITNDAWFMKTAAPYQHAQSSVFRAVENRVPVVRAANTGLSCFVSEKGEITGTVKEGGKEIFVSGYKTKTVDIFKKESLYTKFGDAFAFLCMAFLLASGGRRWLRRYF